MTIWKPELRKSSTPRYLAIADAIKRDVESGALSPGGRLPTHRDLAKHLGVTVGTVTRGYAEAERRGLTVGEVGRGTFVRGEDPEDHGWGAARDPAPGVVDMSLATPWSLPKQEEGRLLAETMVSIARDGGLDELLAYHPDSAPLRQRAAAARWLARSGVDVLPEKVVVTAGAQHAMTVIFSTLLRPGDVVITAELTYPGMKGLAQMLGLRLRGVALDDEGILPDALEAACCDGGAQALYVVPTDQNPTGATMSVHRREAIAEVARAHELLVVEDNVHGALEPDAPGPILSFLPERTVHVTTVSKSVAFGLRTGFVVAPEPLVERLRSGVRSTIWMPAPLMTEITTRWLSDGTAERITATKRVEMEFRHTLVRDILGKDHEVRGGSHSLHVWLTLPDPWRSDEYVAQAHQRGVLIAGAEAFAVGRQSVPHAVRVCLGSVPRREDLTRGLEILANILDGYSDPCCSIV